MMTKMRCPVCGSGITLSQPRLVEAGSALGERDRWSMTETLTHDGPMDAACRLLFEILVDECTASLNRSVQASMQLLSDGT